MKEEREEVAQYEKRQEEGEAKEEKGELEGDYTALNRRKERALNSKRKEYATGN